MPDSATTSSNTGLIVVIFSLLSFIILTIALFVFYYLYSTRKIMMDIPYIPRPVREVDDIIINPPRRPRRDRDYRDY